MVGFTEMIKNKEKEGETVEYLFKNILKEFSNNNEKYNCEDIVILNDMICFVFKENITLKQAIETAKILFRVPNVLFRGAISKGETVVYNQNDSKIIIGDAFLNAYNYTSKFPIAIYLDNEMIKKENIDIYECEQNLLTSIIQEQRVYFITPFDLCFLGYNLTLLSNFVESVDFLYKKASPEQKLNFVLCIQILQQSNQFDFVPRNYNKIKNTVITTKGDLKNEN